MWGWRLCAVAGRLYHPQKFRTGLRSLANHRSAVSTLAVGIRNRRKIDYGRTVATFPSIPMSTRVHHSTKAKNDEKQRTADEVHDHEHHNPPGNNHTAAHDHDHEDDNHNHSHSHSHGIFGAFGHTHSREDTNTSGAQKIVEALKGGSASRHRSVKVPMVTWHNPYRCRPRKSNNARRIVRQHRPDRHQGFGGMVYGMFTECTPVRRF